MDPDTKPALTIAVATAHDAEAARMTLASIAGQTIADRIEVLFGVNPGVDVGPVRPLLDLCGSCRVFDQSPIDNVDRAASRIALEARADFVSIIEDHAFPDPEWAETLLATFAETDADGVGTGVVNANPSSRLSWANFALAYAHWSDANPAGPANWISHHNGSFRTEALRDLGADVVIATSNREGEVVQRIKDAGGTLYFEPACRIRHLNPSNLSSTWALRSDVGRLYGASRAEKEGWGALRRGAYVLLGPAIPFLRYVRMRKEVFRQLPEIRERTHGVALLGTLAFDAAGQMLGYLSGPGQVRDRLAVFEMDRAKHLTRQDRLRFYPATS